MKEYRILKLIVALGFFLSVLALPLRADVGVAIGVYGNMSTFTTEGTEFEPSSGQTTGGNGEQTTAKISEDVDFASLFIELDAREGVLGMAVGLEIIPGDSSLGARTRTDTTTDADEDSQDDGTYTAKANISNHISVYIEPTFYPHENIGFYVKGGASHVTVETLESIAIGTDSSAYGNEGVWGVLLGVGIKATHASGFFAKLEYSETEYGTVNLKSTTGNQNKIEADPEQKSTRFAIGYKF